MCEFMFVESITDMNTKYTPRKAIISRGIARLVRFLVYILEVVVQVRQILGILEIYMIVNFKTCRISRGTHRLTWTSILIKK